MCNFVHSANVFPGTKLTEEGIVISVNDLQPLKAQTSIIFTEGGIDISFNEELIYIIK